MFKKNKLFIILIVLNLIFVIYVLSIVSERNDIYQNIHGTYVSIGKTGNWSLVFDTEENKYYLYDRSDLLKTNTFKVSDVPNVYFLNDKSSEKNTSCFIIEKNRCYFIIDNNIYLFNKKSSVLTHYK